MKQRSWRAFAWDHAWGLFALSAVGICFWISKRFSLLFSECLLHRFLHLYCPLCGGTRALLALLRGHVVEALRSNAWVVFALIAATVWYVLVWIRFLRGKKEPWRLPRAAWIVLALSFFAFGILRNACMLLWGLDPLGDLLPFWNGI